MTKEIENARIERKRLEDKAKKSKAKIKATMEAKMKDIEEKAKIESKRVEDEAAKRFEAVEKKLAAAEEEKAAKKRLSIWGLVLNTMKAAAGVDLDHEWKVIFTECWFFWLFL